MPSRIRPLIWIWILLLLVRTASVAVTDRLVVLCALDVAYLAASAALALAVAALPVKRSPWALGSRVVAAVALSAVPLRMAVWMLMLDANVGAGAGSAVALLRHLSPAVGLVGLALALRLPGRLLPVAGAALAATGVYGAVRGWVFTPGLVSAALGAVALVVLTTNSRTSAQGQPVSDTGASAAGAPAGGDLDASSTRTSRD